MKAGTLCRPCHRRSRSPSCLTSCSETMIVRDLCIKSCIYFQTSEGAEVSRHSVFWILVGERRWCWCFWGMRCIAAHENRKDCSNEHDSEITIHSWYAQQLLMLHTDNSQGQDFAFASGQGHHFVAPREISFKLARSAQLNGSAAEWIKAWRPLANPRQFLKCCACFLAHDDRCCTCVR